MRSTVADMAYEELSIKYVVGVGKDYRVLGSGGDEQRGDILAAILNNQLVGVPLRLSVFTKCAHCVPHVRGVYIISPPRP